MSEKKIFHLPDLGEGLPDATIVEWFVKPGDEIRLDAPLVSMETAKAVVEVPSPVSGKVLKLAGNPGDVIVTGAMLAEFEIDPNLPQRAEGHATGHAHAPPPANSRPAEATPPTASETQADAGTVVGAMQSSDTVHQEAAIVIGGVKAMPAVRALARKLGVDLSRVAGTGSDGAITLKDVKNAAAAGNARAGAASSATVSAGVQPGSPAPGLGSTAAAMRPAERTALSASGRPMRTLPPSVRASGQPEPVAGVRRNMARAMADAHAKVVPTTLCDDADLHAWVGKQDITARLVRAIVAACRSEPALNAWFDGDKLVRTVHPHVDIGIAVDTADGLFVPALRNADMLDATGVRAAVARLRAQVEERSIAASELTGYTISLSNFGMFAGRYATPVVVPPTVAIVGAGRLTHDVVAVMGGVEVHPRLPLSLTFDHRACTGGEAARFLRALLDDLALPH